jgi:hypothetical protein
VLTSKIGFITLDNASNNDTAINELGERLGVNGPKQRIRCFGHILNLFAKALLFGHSSEAFEDELVKNVDAKTHEIWREKGPLESFTIYSIGFINQTFSHTSFEPFKRNSPAGPMAQNSRVFETANRGTWYR